MTRQEEKAGIFEVIKEMCELNPKLRSETFKIFEYGGKLALEWHGPVEGRSLKLPSDWKYSKKNGGTIIEPSFFFMYNKHWRYCI